MARWLRLRKQVPLLIISFLLSSIYRTVMRVWPVSSAVGEVPTSARGTKRGLIFSVGGRLNSGSRDETGRRFSLELSSSFPFLHVQSLAPGLVSVAFSHTPCLSETTRVPTVNAMQFPFGAGQPSNGGVCSGSNAGAGNQFSSNPLLP